MENMGNRETMTVAQAAEITRDILLEIPVPMRYADSIAAPIMRAVGNLNEIIRAATAEPEEQMPEELEYQPEGADEEA